MKPSHNIGDLVLSNDEIIGMITSVVPNAHDPFVIAYHKVVFANDQWWIYGEDGIDTLKDNLKRFLEDA
jgi:uncharacterized membrane protein